MRPKSFKTTLSIIHFALLAGIVLFLVFVYLQNQSFKIDTDSSDVFIYIIPIVAAMGYFGSLFIFKKIVDAITREAILENKLKKYYTASIIKYALIEGPTMIAIVAYYLSCNVLHLIIALSLLVYLFTQRPTNEKITKELKLNREEEKQLDS